MEKYKVTYKDGANGPENPFDNTESLKEALELCESVSDQTQVFIWKLVKEGVCKSVVEGQ